MKIFRKCFKTSPFEKNLPISLTEQSGYMPFIRYKRKRIHLYLMVLCLLLLISILLSCMVGPDYERPILFDDARIERALDLKPLKTQTQVPFSPLDFHDETLEVLLNIALRNSPTIRSAVVKLRQSRAALNISQSALFPTLDAGGKYTYENTGRNMGETLRENYYQAGLDMAWELDIFGGTRRQIESNEAAMKEAVESLKNVYVSLIADVCTQYISLRQNERLIENAKNNLTLQTSIYQTVREQYEAGLTSEISLNQSKYLVETTKMSIPQSEYQRLAAKNALAVLIGVLPGELDNLLDGQKSNLIQQEFTYDTAALYELPADIIRRRPDVRAAEEQLIGANADIGVAVAALFPKVSLSGFLGFGALKFADLPQKNSYGYSYLPQISVPVFHFGALQNQVKLKKAIKEEYLIAYEQALL
ncbi:MAG: efflux transporter outer membrane subunit, partial [Alphaproteobacteria bacterium]